MDTALTKRRQKLLNPSKSSQNNRQSSIQDKGLICTICQAPATGFNFAVITCMCCKAFFRRNALLGLQSLQCRYLTENCAINLKTRRDCSFCRLKKCFDVGMKKELILSEDSKRLKREKILQNRQMTSRLGCSMDSSNTKTSSLLSCADLDCIKSICDAFDEYCRIPMILFEKNEHELLGQQPIKSRIKLQHYVRYYTKYEAALVNFLKSLSDLKDFFDEQQTCLIMHNIRFLIRVSVAETIDDQLPVWPGVNLLLETIFGTSLLNETDILLHKLKVDISDSACIRLLVVVLLFSTYTSYNGDIDTLIIYRIQEKYTKLLWLYLVQNYGEQVACQKLVIITNSCLHLVKIGHLADLRRQQIQWDNIFLSLE